MIPLGWVESTGLTMCLNDPTGHFRHGWRVVFRCPECNKVESIAGGPEYVVAPGAPPAPVTAGQSRLLAKLISDHQCVGQSYG